VAQANGVTVSQELPAGVPRLGTVVAEKYRIDRLIGRGGTGAVFQATHVVTGKKLALKCLVPRGELGADEIERFVREARAAARINHPNIVDIYDVGEHEGSFFLVMEYLRGRCLREWMQKGALEPGPLLRSLLPALRGVHAAHRAGVVHRDLKPENVFLSTDAGGELLATKVLDFGISKVGDALSGTLPSITHTGAVMGTPFYMSREQAEDSSSVDLRTDIYACGVILYEALSGTLPYRADSLTSLLLLIAEGDAVPLRKLRPELPAALESAVMRAMARDPRQRFADMRALIAALEPFAGQRALPIVPDASTQDWLVPSRREPRDPRRPPRRAPTPWLLALLALLVGAALASHFTQGAAAVRETEKTETGTATETGTGTATGAGIASGTGSGTDTGSEPETDPEPAPAPTTAPGSVSDSVSDSDPVSGSTSVSDAVPGAVSGSDSVSSSPRPRSRARPAPAPAPVAPPPDTVRDPWALDPKPPAPRGRPRSDLRSDQF
jgi:eukaryotic-like serine/threonine-protein kinase